MNFLRNHARNGYVWRGFMDMQALSNKYGMPIKIISIKYSNDPKPKVERMEPDKDFEVKEVMEEMILLNTGSYHFDLIQKKKSVEIENETKDMSGDEIDNDSNEKDEKLTCVEKPEREEIQDLKLVVKQMKKKNS